jgi:hypothetical protein
MIRIEGVRVVAERLQKYNATTTADRSARDEFQTGLDMDPGTIVQRSTGINPARVAA